MKYQILLTKCIRILGQIVRRISNEVLGVNEWKDFLAQWFIILLFKHTMIDLVWYDGDT